MMKKFFVASLILLIVSAIALSYAHALSPLEIFESSVLNQVIKRSKLIVGMEAKYFPFEYADKDGKLIGFDADLANLIAKELGVEIEIKDIEWTGLIPALQSGKVDLIISGMTRTLERSKSVTFTDPYFETGLCVLLSKQKASDVKEIQQINASDRIIAVKTGTTGDLVASKMFPKAQINRFKDESACAREVATARADAFIYDQLLLPSITKKIRKPLLRF
ncbi:MAG: transporter substrate-binding domain-containing protein [Desulfobacteraceae bacterium]|nr:transporter substrate-binding domain-containing protein [Desulfobacteraceae bacterium]